MSANDDDLLGRYDDLLGEVGQAFDAIRERQSRHMLCRSGCSDCCRARLSMTHVETAYLRRNLAQLPRERRADVAARAQRDKQEYCPALDPEGRCGIYEVRPLICRSFGVPLRRASREPLIQPSTIDVCDKNFTNTSLAVLPQLDILEHDPLTATLNAIDGEYCSRHALHDYERIPLRQILAYADRDEN